MNLPEGVPASGPRAASLAGWAVRRYAHLSGLDARWQMFGLLPRFDWRFEIKSRKAGREELLPLPLQSGRTSAESLFFDFKEAKFHLNLYPDRELRRAYAASLCRRYGSETIVFELHHRLLNAPAEARARRGHRDGPYYGRVLDEFSCG
jgi:hypothetical protein